MPPMTKQVQDLHANRASHRTQRTHSSYGTVELGWPLTARQIRDRKPRAVTILSEQHSVRIFRQDGKSSDFRMQRSIRHVQSISLTARTQSREPCNQTPSHASSRVRAELHALARRPSALITVGQPLILSQIVHGSQLTHDALRHKLCFGRKFDLLCVGDLGMVLSNQLLHLCEIDRLLIDEHLGKLFE